MLPESFNTQGIERILTDIALAIQASNTPKIWTPYVPTWTASTTNPTIGNGSVTGDFCQIGSMVTARIEVAIGTTTNIGNGRYKWSLPIPTVAGHRFVGSMIALRSGVQFTVATAANVDWLGAIDTANMSAIIFSGVVGQATQAWATGDFFVLELTYAIA